MKPEEIKELAKAISKGVQCYSKGFKFSNNQQLDLQRLGGGFGVRNLTVQNTGNYKIILKDLNQTVDTGESFTVFTGNHVIANNNFEIEFGAVDPYFKVSVEQPVPKKEGSLRYLIDAQ